MTSISLPWQGFQTVNAENRIKKISSFLMGRDLYAHNTSGVSNGYHH
ncbi:MAG: hypothetical protein AB8B87_22985 [Granulosicoccus sp.]